MGQQRQRLQESKKQSIIFIANGFDEEFVVQFYCQQRRKGHHVLIVGNRAGDIFGRYGLNLPSHVTVSEFIRASHASILEICVPGGRPCLNALLSDPRVVTLLKQVNRPIHTTHSTTQIIKDFGFAIHRLATTN